MAKKTAALRIPGPRKRRQRRSPEEIINDLQEEIRRVRARQTARELKRSPAHKAAIATIRAIDKALAFAAGENETALRHALADARKPLGAYLEEKGVRLPKANLPKGPRPRGAAKEEPPVA
ncbi:MAG: hypothetical protein AB1726_08650 [Planctomycetota bacterium]